MERAGRDVDDGALRFKRRVVYLLALVDEANERCVEMRLDVNFRARFGGGTMGAPPSVASNNPAAPLLEVTMTRGEDDPWGERAGWSSDPAPA